MGQYDPVNTVSKNDTTDPEVLVNPHTGNETPFLSQQLEFAIHALMTVNLEMNCPLLILTHLRVCIRFVLSCNQKDEDEKICLVVCFGNHLQLESADLIK